MQKKGSHAAFNYAKQIYTNMSRYIQTHIMTKINIQ